MQCNTCSHMIAGSLEQKGKIHLTESIGAFGVSSPLRCSKSTVSACDAAGNSASLNLPAKQSYTIIKQ